MSTQPRDSGLGNDLSTESNHPEPLDLEPILARLRGASPGPWSQGMIGDRLIPEVDNGVGFGFVVVNPDLADDGAAGVADADFIACARTDVESLVIEVDDLRRSLRLATRIVNARLGIE